MPKTVIVSIHGILTTDHDPTDWQPLYGKWLAKNRPDVIYMPFYYGWIDPIGAWLTSVMRWLKWPDYVGNAIVKKFNKFLLKVKVAYPDANIHIVSHSYGTWITWQTFIANCPLSVQSISFVAGVISSHIEKNCLDMLFWSHQVKSIFIWCSHDDEVVRPLALPPFGHLGYWGLIRQDHPEDRVFPVAKPYDKYRMFNHLTRFEHNGYFDVDSTYEQIQKDVDDSNDF